MPGVLIVASVVLQLVDEKKLNHDDSVSRFDIGVEIPNGNNITRARAMQHSQRALRRYTPQFNHEVTPQTKFDSRTVIDWAVKEKPYFPPSGGYHYTQYQLPDAWLDHEGVTHDTVAHAIQRRLPGAVQADADELPATQATPAPLGCACRCVAQPFGRHS